MGGIVMAFSYLTWKAIYDNQVVFDRRNPYPWRAGVKGAKLKVLIHISLTLIHI